jgi:hypothetical protein
MAWRLIAALPALSLILVMLFSAADAHAVCSCRCVNQFARAVCDSDRDQVPDCRSLACKPAPVEIRPNEAHRRPPPGATRCEQMQIFSPSTMRYQWTQLCIPESRSFQGFLKPAPAVPSVVPYVAPRSSASSGMPCGSDRDCPAGQTCKRARMDAPWQCSVR